MAKIRMRQIANQCPHWREEGANHYQRWGENRESEKVRALEERVKKGKDPSRNLKSSGEERKSEGANLLVPAPLQLDSKKQITAEGTDVIIFGSCSVAGALASDTGKSTSHGGFQKYRLKWDDETTIKLIREIKTEKDALPTSRRTKGKASRNGFDWKRIAGVINHVKARELKDHVSDKKCLHKFDELKRRHKRKCPDSSDIIDYLMDEYNTRIEVKKAKHVQK